MDAFVICFTLAMNVFVLFSLHVYDEIQGFTHLDLGGNHWIIYNEKTGLRSNATVPGSMYTAILTGSGKENPLYRDNDKRFAWIGKQDWTYTSNFTLSSYMASANAVTLMCEGMDTVASIYMNDRLVLKTDNMFQHYKIPVKGFVKKGNNSLTVKFTSAVKEAADRKRLYTYVIPPECPPEVQNGQCHINLLRKEQCSFSWDWGPSFPTQGIWRPISLNSFQNAILTGLSGVPMKVDGQWQLKVEAYFDVIEHSQVKGQISITIGNLGVYHQQCITISSTNNSATFILPVPKMNNGQLWWPRGYGSQTLFNLSCSFIAGSDSSSRQIEIGFRTIELIQDPVSDDMSQGLTFYFRVNGIPIFLKGSNWIPADSFQEKITNTRISYLLQSAADVGMNAMRVWGGGIYESDYFYAMADKLGIMIWQDLMFSVAMYPTNPKFLQSVSTEIKQQVQRLKHHVSIILWAGSNENEKALRDNWFGTQDLYDRYYKDFLQLYVATIKPLVETEDSSRPYLVSSPTNGAESVKEGYVAKDPSSELYGDIHYYDYAIDQWNSSVFLIPRSATEYGIQAWCNAESLSAVFDEVDFSMTGYMAAHRQHHSEGNLEMAAEVGIHMHLPTSSDEKRKFFDFIYLTQINQAMSMRTQTEHYRRFQNVLQSDGRGLTMAALYWQLNDIWQAPTWASIDYEGRWKMLHYYAKHFFSPHLVSPFFQNKMLKVFIVVDEIAVDDKLRDIKGVLTFQPMKHFSQVRDSDLPLSQTFKVIHSVAIVTGGFLKIEIYRYSSFEPLFSWTVPYKLKATSNLVFKKKITTLLSEAACPSKEDCILSFKATNSVGAVLSRSWLPMAYPKFSNLMPALITIKAVTKISSTTYRVDLSTDHIALFVWLSHPSIWGRFSDNGFPMFQPNMSIEFYTNTTTLSDIVKSNLHVISITDVK